MENKYLEKIAISDEFINRRIKSTTNTDRLKRFAKNQNIRANNQYGKVRDIHDHIVDSGLPMEAHIDDIKKAVNIGNKADQYKESVSTARAHASHIKNTRQLPVPVQRPNLAGKIFLKLKAHPKLVAGAVGAAAVAGIGKSYLNKNKNSEYRYG